MGLNIPTHPTPERSIVYKHKPQLQRDALRHMSIARTVSKAEMIAHLVDHDLETTITLAYLRDILTYGFVGYNNMSTVDLATRSRLLGLFEDRV